MSAVMPLIESRALSVFFGGGRKKSVQAVRAIDLAIRAGECVALVGESGSGKSTFARAMIRSIEPSAGQILYRGEDVTHAPRQRLRALRRRVQIVFQDPYGSLNPRLSVGAAIAEPLIVHGLARGRARGDRVAECLTLVGMDPGVAARRPHEFSGGQRQRICIARALACGPEFIVADEILSALDISLRGQMLDLLKGLRAGLGLTYLFISHDLEVVRRIADRVAVMYLGRIVELAPTSALMNEPHHPYTAALLAAAPLPDPIAERARRYVPLGGEPPSPTNPPTGCAFHTRCHLADAHCRSEAPPLRAIGAGRSVACHKPLGSPRCAELESSRPARAEDG
jgi:oligopeptide/dipeptide ABC transporter ATP-binding protein